MNLVYRDQTSFYNFSAFVTIHSSVAVSDRYCSTLMFFMYKYEFLSSNKMLAALIKVEI